MDRAAAQRVAISLMYERFVELRVPSWSRAVAAHLRSRSQDRGEHPSHGVGERLSRFRCAQKASHSSLDRIAASWHVGGDHRLGHRRRLQQDPRHAFAIESRKHHAVGGGNQRPDVRRTLRIVDHPLVRPSAQDRVRGTAIAPRRLDEPEYLEPTVRVIGADSTSRFDKLADALVPEESGGQQEGEWLAFGASPVDGRELFEIDAGAGSSNAPGPAGRSCAQGIAAWSSRFSKNTTRRSFAVPTGRGRSTSRVRSVRRDEHSAQPADIVQRRNAARMAPRPIHRCSA